MQYALEYAATYGDFADFVNRANRSKYEIIHFTEGPDGFTILYKHY